MNVNAPLNVPLKGGKSLIMKLSDFLTLTSLIPDRRTPCFALSRRVCWRKGAQILMHVVDLTTWCLGRPACAERRDPRASDRPPPP
jgi:hypothetical protein